MSTASMAGSLMMSELERASAPYCAASFAAASVLTSETATSALHRLCVRFYCQRKGEQI
ncbi:hypothetical protein [Rhizobium lusitanum]|uniref:hypothetical protein n=1 Tax=Rhizobium lusitanum TaxID=293958 RepID=UPI001FED8FD8|nr:hypothetical protein [Rhizobium lusitanum]